MSTETYTASIRIKTTIWEKLPRRKGIIKEAVQELTEMFTYLFANLSAKQQQEYLQKYEKAIALLEAMP